MSKGIGDGEKDVVLGSGYSRDHHHRVPKVMVRKPPMIVMMARTQTGIVAAAEAAAEAADISERTLIAAADALGVRAYRGQWWLPG